jgi:hypothetical protein
MLHARTVLSRDGVTVADVACRHDLGPDLACALSVSPHHLSRVFHSITGHTISSP